MDQQKEKTITQIIESDRNQRVRFYQTQQKLLKQGYSESDIVYALYSAPFSNDPLKPRPPHPLAELYQHNPEQAQAIAKTLLQDQRQEDWGKTALDAGAAAATSHISGAGMQVSAYYDVLAFDRLGIPYFTVMFIGFALVIAAIKLGWSTSTTHMIILIYAILINLIFLYKLIIDHKRIKKP